MEITDTSDVITALNESAGGSETWRVETFTMQRESATHGHQTVTVTILDRGPAFTPRYAVSAESDTGQKCAGNSEDDLDVAIRATHWYQLDR